MSETMVQNPPFLTGIPVDRDDVAAAADRILHTVRAARILGTAGRPVRLDGLEAQVAQLCARCLGLEGQDQGKLRQLLLALRAELDVTIALQATSRESASCPSTTY